MAFFNLIFNEKEKNYGNVITGKRTEREFLSWQRNCDWTFRDGKKAVTAYFSWAEARTAETEYL